MSGRIPDLLEPVSALQDLSPLARQFQHTVISAIKEGQLA